MSDPIVSHEYVPEMDCERISVVIGDHTHSLHETPFAQMSEAERKDALANAVYWAREVVAHKKGQPSCPA